MKNTNSRLVDFTVNDDDLIVKARLGNTVYQCNSYPKWEIDNDDDDVIAFMNDTNIEDAIVPDDTVVTFMDYATVGSPDITVYITGDGEKTISTLLAAQSKKLVKSYVFGEIDGTHYYCVCELGAST